jgi:hypothetical protein
MIPAKGGAKLIDFFDVSLIGVIIVPVYRKNSCMFLPTVNVSLCEERLHSES